MVRRTREFPPQRASSPGHGGGDRGGKDDKQGTLAEQNEQLAHLEHIPVATSEQPISGTRTEDSAGSTQTGEGEHAAAPSRDAEPGDGRRESVSTPRVRPGSRLGRYTVLERLGAGGMGEVFAAYDPTLDRRIALKLVHARRSKHMEHHERLLREAKALAQLSHPNVVTVHDVGTIDNEIFIAMEYVEGTVLSRWLQRRAHTWREVQEVFMRAGEGLAAAHAAGLIHRDFKPANVIIGNDGRVRVLDFGIAAWLGERTPHKAGHLPTVSDEPTDDRATTERLTVTGMRLGTPAYMAPEQHSGGEIDERSDQFAFCVSLYEALYGVLPFAGHGAAQLGPAKLAGRLGAPPSGTRMPGWLRAVLVRGLAADPDARYPSIKALLTEVARDRSAKPRTLAIAAAGAVLVIASLGAMGWTTLRALAPPAQPCRSAGALFAEVWGPQPARQLRTVLDLGAAPERAAVWQRIEQNLDGYRDEWVGLHTEICMATHTHGTQSPALLDMRMLCLRRRRDEVGALVAELGQRRGDSLAALDEGVQRISRVSDCADMRGFSAQKPLPADTAARAQIGDSYERIAQAKALGVLGESTRALERARAATDLAAASGYEPVSAEASLLLGELYYFAGKYQEAEVAYHRALVAAEAGRAQASKLRAAVALAGLASKALYRPDESEHWLDYAQATLRADDKLDIEHNIIYERGWVARRRGNYVLAESYFRHAIELAMPIESERSILVGELYNDLAIAMNEQHKAVESLEYFQRSLTTLEQILSPEHPRVARAAHNLGDAYREVGRLSEARTLLLRAIRIWEQQSGSDYDGIAIASANLGLLELQKGNYDRAHEYQDQAIAIYKAKMGANEPYMGMLHSEKGLSYNLEGRCTQALPEHERAVALWKPMGAEHPTLALMLLRWAEAEAMCDQAVSARAHLVQALAIAGNAADADERIAALAQLVRAQLSWLEPSTRDQAVRMAETARTLADELAKLDQRQLLHRRIERWLAARSRGEHTR